jgi:cephalosporin hydroxylase
MSGGLEPGLEAERAAGQTEERLPPPVSISLDEPVGKYWLDRVRQVMFDSYMGVPIGKFPEDLRVYEHLLWASRANVVVEIGAQFGGSALWFRDRLTTMARYGRIAAGRVFSIDVNTQAARDRIDAADPADITLIEGDVLDPGLARRVTGLIPPGSRCFVIEDSAHTFETTTAALRGFAPLVPLGGYFVVEDGCVDIEELRLMEAWPRGVLPAIRDWLSSTQGSEFTERRDLERYGMSCHPHGFLQRVRERGDASAPKKSSWHSRLTRTAGRTSPDRI